MNEYCGWRFAARPALLALACLLAAPGLTACSDWKQVIGIDQPAPDEFAVESRAPLTIPPDFSLRPPKPGAPRPQEASASERVQSVINTAGPGTPSDQASSALLPDTMGAAADPERSLPPGSLASKLLSANDSSTGGSIDRRATDPLTGVY
jgi:hypothetical protein